MADDTQLLDDGGALDFSAAAIHVASLRQVLRNRNALHPTMGLDATPAGPVLGALTTPANNRVIVSPTSASRPTTRLSEHASVLSIRATPQHAPVPQTHVSPSMDGSVVHHVDDDEATPKGTRIGHDGSKSSEAESWIEPSNDPLPRITQADRSNSSGERELVLESLEEVIEPPFRPPAALAQSLFEGTLLVQDLTPRASAQTAANEDSDGAGRPFMAPAVIGMGAVFGVQPAAVDIGERRAAESLASTLDDGLRPYLDAAMAAFDGEEPLEIRAPSNVNGNTSSLRDEDVGGDAPSPDATCKRTDGLHEGDDEDESQVLLFPQQRLEGHVVEGPTTKKTPSSRSPTASTLTGGFALGTEVEAKWGAAWYPAVVVSQLGKSTEVQWKKDGSRVFLNQRHVRLAKHPEAGHVACSPRKEVSKVPLTSATQMVQALQAEEQDELAAKRLRSVRPQSKALNEPSASDGAPFQPVTAATAAVAPIEAEKEDDAGATPRHQPMDPLEDDVSPAPRIAAATIHRHVPHSVTNNRSASADFGDWSTPPAVLMYVTPTAAAHLPDKSVVSQWASLVPGGCMCVNSLADVVSWGANTAFQDSVSFIIVIDPEGASRPESHDSFALHVALAMGVTAVRWQWLASTEAGGVGRDANRHTVEPATMLPPDVHVVIRPPLSSNSQHANTSHPPSFCLTAGRFLPLPRTLRVCCGDVVWLPQPDPLIEALTVASGMSTVTKGDDPTLQRSRGVLTSTGQQTTVQTAYVYTPPKVRLVGRDATHAANLVNLDIPWLLAAIRTHFEQSISTRPVSVANASRAQTPSAVVMKAGLTEVDMMVIDSCASLQEREAAAVRALDLSDSQPPLVPASIPSATTAPTDATHGSSTVPKRPRPEDDESLSLHMPPPPPQQPRRRPELRIALPLEEAPSSTTPAPSPRLYRRGALPLPSSASNVLRTGTTPPPSIIQLTHTIDEASSHSAPHYPVLVGDDFYFALPDSEDQATREVGRDGLVGVGRVVALDPAGDSVTLRLYHFTQVVLRRPVSSTEPSATRSLPVRKLMSLALTDEVISVPFAALDFDTPLFILDERQLDHLYILQAPPPAPPIPPPMPIAITVEVDGVTRLVQPSGSCVTFRNPGQALTGAEEEVLSGITCGARRDDTGAGGVVLLVRLSDNGPVTVVTPDMLLGVSES